MNLSSLRIPLLLAALSLVSMAGSLAACSDDDPDNSGGGAGTTGAAGSSNAGDATKGAAVADKFACKGCHGADYSGNGYYPNITNDADTGLGKWTDDQIKDAIRNGKDDEGKELCTDMLRYTSSQIDDAGMANLIAFLRSMSVKNAISGTCPP